jgi:CzcA family heavy metal efflux pump
MMRWIIESSLRLRFLVLAIAAAMIVLGIVQLRNVPVDVFPEFAPPYVEVQTEALGLSTAEVESLITVPMEEILHGVSWLQTMRSESIPGLSSIVLIFEPGTNLLRARALVQERLTQAQGLPTANVSKPPTMLQPLSSTSRVMMIGLTSEEISHIEMSVLARWTIRPRLMGVPGVANVSIWGQRERQLQVQVDPERLHGHGISLGQIIRTAGDALWVSPLSFLQASTPGVTGGFVDTPNQRLGIRHLLPIVSPEDLAKVTVDGTTLRLGDVVDVVEDHQPLIGDAVINGGPGLLIVVEKFPNANSLEATNELEAALDELGPALTGIEIDPTIFRPATYIEMALGNLSWSVLIGLLLVLLVLTAFFFQWRVVVICLVAIPLSLVVAGLVLYWRGATFNTLVLAGFAIALCAIVDDAIIDTENIMRRLRQQKNEGGTKPVTEVIVGASLEMRNAIVFATLIMVLAVVPVFFIEGVSGSFFRPLALSYVLALLASMAVIVIITPALSVLLLSSAPLNRNDPPLVRGLQRLYDRALAPIIRSPRLAYLIVALTVVVGLTVLPLLGQSLLPTLKDPNLLIPWVGAAGTSRPEMSRLSSLASEHLKSIPGIHNFAAQIGRAITGDEVVSVNSSQLWVSLDPSVSHDETVAQVQAAVESYPGLRHEVLSYLQERVREVLTGTDNAIVVRIFGPDLNGLRSRAEEVEQALSGINGIVDLQIDLEDEEPTVEIEVDIDKAQPYGLKPGDVRRAAATLVNGLEVGNLFEEQKVFEVMVVGAPELRQSLTSLREMLIDTPDGGQVRLGEVADVRIVPAPNMIKREGVSRRIDIGANVQGRDLGAVAQEVESRLQQIEFPLEYHAVVLGEYAERQAAAQRLLSLTLAALIGIFLLLQAAFGSWRLATLSFLTLPAALVGGVLAVYITDGNISLGSLVGFLAVLGIAARTCIMLFSHYQYLEEVEGVPFGPDLVKQGAKERLSPILMTAITTAVALLPLILFGNIPGHEIARPMSIVILGGLVTSTLLNLWVMPVLYLRFGARSESDKIDVPYQYAPTPAGD